ncbi:PDZ domain-containing protein [Levilactobacillus bambusae]|uniref:Serine protease n=1 Tax=Levilactobacillus bambusae TaxID=2024736 RepID=A0A2V1MZA8_9LACO|nr:PDZ domain-containing protein [Levilactobacillus bambusae]PWF99419.1 serine protease [Levilactobacillus bambusae]
MKTLLAIGFYLLQPALWIAIIRVFVTSNRRISRERKSFTSAVYSDHFEWRHFLTGGIEIGLILSLISGLVGLTLPLSSVVLYEIVVAISLIIVPGAIFPVLIVLGVILVAQFMPQMETEWLQPVANVFGASRADTALGNGLLWLTLVLLGIAIFVWQYAGRFPSPQLVDERRGKQIANYPWRELLLAPLVILIPGSAISNVLPFWPLFQIQGQSYTILVLPLLIGVRFTVFRRVPREVYQRLGRQLSGLAGLGLLTVMLTYFIPAVAWVGIIILCVGYLWLLWRTKQGDRHYPFWYSKVDNGIRVLGIRPNTPATKMNLHIGDVILECNHKKVRSETELYEALLINPTYCHLKVQDRDGNFQITETAIYTGAPHEIGIVLFQDQN